MPVKGFKEFQRKFKTLADKMTEAMDNAAKDAAYMAVREMKKNVKKNKSVYTGRLWNSIQAERIRPLLWGVGSEAAYQWNLEYGSRPHKPPFRAILDWVRLKNRWYGEKGKEKAYPIAKRVQETIAEKGTKPHPFIRPAHETVRKEIPKVIEKRMRKMIERHTGR